MKSSVAITLIVCGTALIAVPYVFSTINTLQVAEAMVALEKDVNLRADMPKHADTACMFGGIAMIVVGAIAGLKSGKPQEGSDSR